jgi:hypothetical protein
MIERLLPVADEEVAEAAVVGAVVQSTQLHRPSFLYRRFHPVGQSPSDVPLLREKV